MTQTNEAPRSSSEPGPIRIVAWRPGAGATETADVTELAAIAAEPETRIWVDAVLPGPDEVRAIATALTGSVTGNKNNEPHGILNMGIPSGTIIPAGHRLLWTIEYASSNQENDVTFRFDGAASPAFARICATAVRPSIGKNVDKPIAVPGVDSAILNPRDTWADKANYDATADKLVNLFNDNFAKFLAHVDDGVRSSAPGQQQVQASARPEVTAA